MDQQHKVEAVGHKTAIDTLYKRNGIPCTPCPNKKTRETSTSLVVEGGKAPSIVRTTENEGELVWCDLPHKQDSPIILSLYGYILPGTTATIAPSAFDEHSPMYMIKPLTLVVTALTTLGVSYLIHQYHHHASPSFPVIPPPAAIVITGASSGRVEAKELGVP